MKKENIKFLALSGMFLALGVVLPFLTGQIPQIGSMLLPMHIPVFLCAFICGPQYGVPIAFILPLFRSFVFAVPNLYPEAIAIAFEMATYAFVAGFMYSKSRRQYLRSLYRCLITSMLIGRVVRVLIQLILLGINKTPFTIGVLLSDIIIKGIPGIILQLIIIPAIMALCHKTKLKIFINKKTTNIKNKHSRN